jgi:hypothetical protein
MSDAWPDEGALLEAFKVEFNDFIKRQPSRLTLTVSPDEAWALIAQLQVAARHPINRTYGPSMRLARGVADRLATMFPLGPAMQEVMRRGWDPAHDKRLPEP